MISREFLENIESGDLMTVRSALLDDLIIDRTFKTFDEDFKAANERLELLVPFDGEPLETDSEKWDKEYLNQQKVALMVNFSEKRIDHLKAVISKVMPPDLSRNSNTTVSHQEPSDSRTGRTVRTERVIVRETEKNKVEPRTTPKSTSTKTNPTPRSGSGSGRTGRRVINETASERDESGKKKAETDGVGTALIIGGFAATAVGIAIAEPIVIGAGVVVAGAGVCVKASNRSERDESGKKKAETDEVGTALIIGGFAATAVGIAIAEPIVIGAGVVVAGAGVCVKASNRR